MNDMAKTQAEQIKELTASLAELDAQLRVLTERVESLREDVLHCTKRLDELVAKVAGLEERSRNLEKLSDRSFSFGQAAIISLISIVSSALVTLLIQLAVKK
jgi:uncharacterized coiled-coil DUF342 family protein